jgi:hypothetical protein
VTCNHGGVATKGRMFFCPRVGRGRPGGCNLFLHVTVGASVLNEFMLAVGILF